MRYEYVTCNWLSIRWPLWWQLYSWCDASYWWWWTGAVSPADLDIVISDMLCRYAHLRTNTYYILIVPLMLTYSSILIVYYHCYVYLILYYGLPSLILSALLLIVLGQLPWVFSYYCRPALVAYSASHYAVRPIDTLLVSFLLSLYSIGILAVFANPSPWICAYAHICGPSPAASPPSLPTRRTTPSTLYYVTTKCSCELSKPVTILCSGYCSVRLSIHMHPPTPTHPALYASQMWATMERCSSCRCWYRRSIWPSTCPSSTARARTN